MLSKSTIFALAASISSASAAIQGFNYGSTGSDGSTPFVQSDYEAQFNAAKTLVGHSGFNSARLYTMIQAGGDNSAITQAIPAAINTGTKLLLGMWGSGGQEGFNNELAVFKAAVQQHGTKLTDLIQAISVGSEDLYRISPTGIKNKSGVGADPDVLVNYINQLRSSMRSMGMTKPIMHVDTWTAWVNDSNSAVVDAVDIIGTDAYPYFQNTMANSIENAKQLFFDAYDATVAHAQGKEVWITETGFPVSGKTENLAVPSLQNAKTYWDQVACQVLGKINTYWYTLQDTDPVTPNPSFGIVGYPVTNKPKYDLTCPAGSPGAGYNGKGNSHSSLPSYESMTKGQETKTESNVVYSTHWLTVTSSPAVYGHTTTSTMTFYETVTCDECAGSSYPQPTGYPTGVSATPTGKSPASGTCPANLSGPYQTPHLIVPMNSEQPTRAYGTQYNGQVSSTMSTVFNFDIPESYSGNTCTLVFLFPQKEQLETSSYTMSGQGGIDVKKLKAPATQSTTYETCPTGEHVGGVSDLQPGNSYVIYSGPCAAGETVSYEFSGTGSLDVNFFEDWNPSPLGCFITAC